MSDEWYARAVQAAGPAPVLRLHSEAVGDAATLSSIASFLGVHASKLNGHHHLHGSVAALERTASVDAPLSSASARASSHARDELTTPSDHLRVKRGRAVMLTAATAFAATCLAGTCFALGVAVGQRMPKTKYTPGAGSCASAAPPETPEFFETS